MKRVIYGFLNLGAKLWLKITGIWGEWGKDGGKGIRGWIWDNIWKKIPDWASIQTAIGGLALAAFDFGDKVKDKVKTIWGWWPPAMAPEGSGVGIVGWFHDKIYTKIPSWSDIWGVLKNIGGGAMDILGVFGGRIGKWFGDVWGSWEDREGIIGWIRKNTVDHLPSMDDLMMGIGSMMADLNLADPIREWTKGGAMGDRPGIIGYKMKSIGDIFIDLKDWVVGSIGSLWEKLEGIVPSFDIKWPEFSWIKNIGGIMLDKVADTVMAAISGDGYLSKGLNWVLTNVPGIGKLKDWALARQAAATKYVNPYLNEPGSGGGASFGQLGVSRVPGSPGEAVPYILHAGEAVVPAHLAGSSTYMNSMVAGTSPAGTQYVDQKNFNITINSTWAPSDLVNDLSNIKDMNTSSYFNALGA